MDVSGMKLGCLPAKRDDRTLRFEKYVDRALLPHVPDTFDWHRAVGGKWGMLANDKVGDCAIAGPFHRIMMMLANATGKTAVFTDDDAVGIYSAITGYVPGDPSTDNGSNMLDVEKYLHSVGFKGHTFDAYVSVNPADWDMVRCAAWMFGGVELGVNLPRAWQQVQLGGTWKGPASQRDLRGPWAPGSWGGHDVCGGKADPLSLAVVTWGGEMTLTKTAFGDYVSEVWVGVSKDWFDSVGHAPSGFDWQTLFADLADVTDGRVPAWPTPPSPFPPAPTPGPTPAPVPGPAPVPAAGWTLTIRGSGDKPVVVAA